MANIFDFTNYKEYVRAWLRNQPKAGHGQLSRMASALRSSSVVMTQVFRGTRDLTPEQALGAARFLGLTEAETEYFLLLVHRARAGTYDLTILLDKQLRKLKERSQEIQNRIEHETLNEDAKAKFYSSWLFSAIRLGLAIPGKTPTSLADSWDIDRRRASEICDFLLQRGLLTKTKNEYALGPAVLHLAHDHPLVARHHGNWRAKAIDSVERPHRADADDFHYTGPMVISASLAGTIRKELLKLVEQLTPRIKKADNEQLHCLTMDWFRLT